MDAGMESINIEERSADISTVNVGTQRNRDHLAMLCGYAATLP